MKRIMLLLAALALVIVPTVSFGQSNPLHNYGNPLDVDANLKVQIHDALLVIHEIETLRSAGDGAVVPLALTPHTYFWDTNGDAKVSAGDAFLVIHQLTTTSVPEPSTIVLGLCGAGLLAGYGLRRKRLATHRGL